MKIFKTLIFLAALFLTLSINAKEVIKLNLSCNFTGITYDGEISTKPFTEEFKNYSDMEDSGKFKGWGIEKTEFISNGKKYDLVFSTVTSDYAVASFSRMIGKGLGRKILVFTYIFDLQAVEVHRVVTSLPKGMEERTHTICKNRK